MKINRNLALTLICILLGVILSWQYKSIYENRKIAAYENKSIEDLKSDLIAEQKKYDNLYEAKKKLEEELKAYEEAKGSITQTTENLKKSLDNARLIAGLTDVKGKGVIITISDYPPAYVIERNILEVLNELKASDVQAISINNERIVAMSEVREAGKFIMINGKQMQSPFVIKAIADPENLEHSIKMVGGIKQTLESEWLLKVDVEKSDNIVIPKVRDDGSVIKIDWLIPVN